MIDEQIPGDAELALKFDVRTVLISMWCHRHRFFLVLLVALLAGTCAGLLFGERTWTSRASLLYRPLMDESESGLATRQSLVTTPGNLELLRQRLALAVPIKTLAKAVEAMVEPKTDLMILYGTSDTAQGAADFTNALVDVFQEQLVALRCDQLTEEIARHERNLGAIEKKLVRAEEALSTFRGEHDVVDMEQQLDWYLKELVDLDAHYKQLIVMRRARAHQDKDLDSIVEELTSLVGEEREQANATEGLEDKNRRITTLRTAIEEDRRTRENEAALDVVAKDLVRLTELREMGAISDKEYDDALGRFEVQAARTIDTPRIAAWRKELAGLNAQATGSAGTSETFSVSILKEITMKEFDLQLQRSALEVEVEDMAEMVEVVHTRLTALSVIRREHDKLVREVESLAKEKQTVRDAQALARLYLASDAGDFVSVHIAEPPVYPTSSNRKLIAGGVLFVVIFFGWVVLLVQELLYPKIRSAAEFRQRIDDNLLATLNAADTWEVSAGQAMSEVESGLALRRILLKTKTRARLIVTSATEEEPRIHVAMALARAARHHKVPRARGWSREPHDLGPGGMRVLVVRYGMRHGRNEDAIRMPGSETFVRQLNRAGNRARDFLRPYVHRLEDRHLSRVRRVLHLWLRLWKFVCDIDNWQHWRVLRLVGVQSPGPRRVQGAGSLSATQDEGVTVCDMEPVQPGHGALEEALGEVGAVDFDLVFFVTSPVLTAPDLDNLVRHMDGVLLVVKSHGPPVGAVRAALTRLEGASAQVLGTILTGTAPEHREPTWS